MSPRRRGKRPVVLVGAWMFLAMIVLGLVAITLAVLSDDGVSADIGRLSEVSRSRPADVPAAEFTLATDDWNLSSIRLGGADPLSGGSALADVDNDGDLDLLIASGSVVFLPWEGTGFGLAQDLDIDDAAAITTDDLDGDGWPDLLVARTSGDDVIVWGGEWSRSAAAPTTSRLNGGSPSAILIAADLDLDGRSEIVRLGRGGRAGSSDLIWTATEDDPRSFEATALLALDRLSLAAEIADIDGDGLLDIWVTRDVGYDTGGDSLYSRQGAVDGEWVDISAELDSARAIDGMGVTLADLDGNLTIDAYISDIGDNEILLSTAAGFVAGYDMGAARIRPPGADDSVISSSWAAGAVDVNLDGILDLVVVGGGFPNSTVLNKIPGTSVIDAESPAILLGIGGGIYVDDWPSVGINLTLVARSLTMGDIDGDGDTDLVIVTVDGEVAALRNESTAPSVTIALGAGCGEGLEVEIETIAGSFRSVIPAHTYGGAHAREISIGTQGAAVTVRLYRPGQSTITQTIAPGARQRLTLDCPR